MAELVPFVRGEAVAFGRQMVYIVGCQHLVYGSLVEVMHGDECIGKDLLHTPAVSIEFWVVSACDAARPYMIGVQTVGNGFHAMGVEHSHSGEEVVLGTAQAVNEA